MRIRCLGYCSVLLAVLALGTGCGTTRVTDTKRTATEQLLISDAIDRSVSQFDCRCLASKPVYFDAQYLECASDRGYLVSSLRQHLLACGALLVEDRAKATYVVEARAGAVGTDRHQLLVGVPQMNLPSVLPGQPSTIPEIPVAKRTDQKGVAKVAIFAFNRLTGKPVWQSGIVVNTSKAKDTWICGAGPFRHGTIGQGMEVAGWEVPLGTGAEEQKAAPAPSVTQAASWEQAGPKAMPEIQPAVATKPAPQGP